MSQFRKQRPRVKHWRPMPGQSLPDPIIEDDSDLFPPHTVKEIRAWLESIKDSFRNQPPTPITVTLTRKPQRKTIRSTHIYDPMGKIKATVEYALPVPPIRADEFLGVAQFRPCTVEMTLKDWRFGPVIAGYSFLAARDQNNRCIVGPQIKRDQRAQLSLPRHGG